MSPIQSVCVFCGASNSIADSYFEEGQALGKRIASSGYQLVYGAGDCGVMGAVARGALQMSGHVTGVFPEVIRGIEKEHQSLSETFIVPDMHTRKMEMFNRSDAFIILPGGFGTMDETFEVITWKQLHTHCKPIILYNFQGYWDAWQQLTDQFITQGFAHPDTKKLYHIVNNMNDVFALLSANDTISRNE